MPREDKPHMYDIRVVERYITRGDLEAGDYDDYLDSLPDLADAAEPLDIGEPDQDDIAIGRGSAGAKQGG